MRNAATALRQKYIEMLTNGKKMIAIDGHNIPVYDTFINDNFAPEYSRAKKPAFYWIISNATAVDTSLRQKFRADYTIQLDSFTIYGPGQGGNLLCDKMEDEAMQRIMKDQVGAFDITGFSCRETRLELSRPEFTQLKDNSFVYRKITIFRHSIEEI